MSRFVSSLFKSTPDSSSSTAPTAPTASTASTPNLEIDYQLTEGEDETITRKFVTINVPLILQRSEILAAFRHLSSNPSTFQEAEILAMFTSGPKLTVCLARHQATHELHRQDTSSKTVPLSLPPQSL
jgi:hypothetical protein